MKEILSRINIKQLSNQYKIPVFYTSGSVIKALAQIIVAFIIAKYVTPDDLGLWATINLLVTYSLFLQAGLISGLNLELPLALGKGENEKAQNMAGTAQTFILIYSIVIIISGLLLTFLYTDRNPKVQYGILAISFVIILSLYQKYLTSTFRSKDSFLKLSYIQIVDTFVNLVTLVLVVYFSYYGLVIKAIIVLLIYVLLLHYNRPIKVRLLWNKEAFFKIMKVGLPIFALAYLESLCLTVDKLWLLKYSGLTDVGLYTFGFYGLISLTMLTSSIATYIYPRMSFNFSKMNDKIMLWRQVKKITLIVICILTPIAVVGYLLIPMIVTNFFPNYILSIGTMQILIIAGALQGSAVGANALWSIKSWKYMIILKVSYSFLYICFTYVGIRLFPNMIEGVAYGVLLASLIYSIIAISLTYLATNK